MIFSIATIVVIALLAGETDDEYLQTKALSTTKIQTTVRTKTVDVVVHSSTNFSGSTTLNINKKFGNFRVGVFKDNKDNFTPNMGVVWKF